MKTLLLMVALAGPAAAQLADAPGLPNARAEFDPARRTLEGWFAGFEFVPTGAHYARLGTALGPALVSIAEDRGAHPLVRARAVSAMVYASGRHSEDALVRLLSNADAISLLRRKAVLALVDRSGVRYLDLVVSAFAATDDVPLREACARALRSLGPAAYAIRDTLFRETNQPTVKALLGETKQIGVGR